MRNLEEEKELVITTGPKISDLPASKDILDLESLIFTVVKIQNEKILKIRAALIFALCLLYLGSNKCLTDL